MPSYRMSRLARSATMTRLRWFGQSTIELSCAHATIDGRVVFDGVGQFDVAGTFVRERGGPVCEGETPDAHPARSAGTVHGDAMTLSITLADDGSTVAPLALTKGVPGRLVKCL